MKCIDCSAKISITSEGIWIEHPKCPTEMLMYFDANSLLELIKEAQKIYVGMVNLKNY